MTATALFRLLLAAAALSLAACSHLPQPPNTAGNRLDLPPVTEPATGRHHPGKIVWHDLLTPDPRGAEAFYGALFGWSFRTRGDERVIYHQGRAIGGLLPIHPQRRDRVPAQWLVVMSVPELETAASRVPVLDGRVINGPMDLGPRGRALLVADPAGAHLVLLDSPHGDPDDHRPALGDWLWNEVWTLDPAPEVRFYEPLGRYGRVIQGADYRILVNEGRWRAGIRQIRQVPFAGRWVPVVRVADPARSAELAQALGGTLWLRPGEGGAGADTALIADPAGALLILQRWTFASDQGGQ